MTFLHLFHNLVSITSEVATSSSTVLLPCLQADPAEVMLALHRHTATVPVKSTGIKWCWWKNAANRLVMDVSRHVGLWRRAWSVLELSQLSMCTDWPGAATCKLVRCWNRSNLAPGSAHSSIPWGSRDRQVWTWAHVPRGNWWRDQLSWRCGGAILRSTAPARRPGPWERTRKGTSGECYKNPCAAAVGEDSGKWQIVNECSG